MAIGDIAPLQTKHLRLHANSPANEAASTEFTTFVSPSFIRFIYQYISIHPKGLRNSVNRLLHVIVFIPLTLYDTHSYIGFNSLQIFYL